MDIDGKKEYAQIIFDISTYKGLKRFENLYN